MPLLQLPDAIPQSQPVLDERSGDTTLPKLLHRIYWLYLNAIRTVLAQAASAIDTLQTTFVGGQSSLTHVGRVTKVTAAGTIGETSFLDTAVVQGAASLTNAGKLPKVSSAGTVSESAATDDGTDIALASRGLTLTGDSATVEPTQITLHDTQATTPDRRFRIFNSGNICYVMQNMFLNAAGQFGLDAGARPGIVLVINNNNFSIQTLPAGSATGTAPTLIFQSVCASGNAVVLGSMDAASYKVGGVAGITGALTLTLTPTTIQYKDWAGVNQSIAVITNVTLTANAFTAGVRTT